MPGNRKTTARTMSKLQADVENARATELANKSALEALAARRQVLERQIHESKARLGDAANRPGTNASIKPKNKPRAPTRTNLPATYAGERSKVKSKDRDAAGEVMKDSGICANCRLHGEECRRIMQPASNGSGTRKMVYSGCLKCRLQRKKKCREWVPPRTAPSDSSDDDDDDEIVFLGIRKRPREPSVEIVPSPAPPPAKRRVKIEERIPGIKKEPVDVVITHPPLPRRAQPVASPSSSLRVTKRAKSPGSSRIELLEKTVRRLGKEHKRLKQEVERMKRSSSEESSLPDLESLFGGSENDE